MNMLPSIFLCGVILQCAASGASPAAAATHIGSTPYRTSSTGAGNSYAPVLSADGKHVAFVSHANNLVTNDDLAPHLDLFVRDLVASNTALVSVSSNGIGGANDNIGLYTLSSNAQVIAFETTANNLAQGDTNRWRDIYIRDLENGITRLITPGANNHSSNPLISEDGQRVIFESLASNLVTNDFNGTNDIFIHDLTTGVTELVTLNASNTSSPDGPSYSPSISADGLTVAFASRATNVVLGVTNRLDEIYVRDIARTSNLWAQAHHLASTHSISPSAGTMEPLSASEPVLSGDGRYVVFKTLGDTVRFDLSRPVTTVFLIFTNRSFPVITSYSFDDNPRLAPPAATGPLAFTSNGRFLAYNTRSNAVLSSGVALVDFDSVETNVFTPQLPLLTYITNVVPKVRIVLSNGGAGSTAGWTRLSWLHLDDGAARIFLLADRIGPSYPTTAGLVQLFQFNLPSGPPKLLSVDLNSQMGSSLDGIAPAVSPDGSLIAWDSPDDKMVADDLNRASDVFVRNVDTGETTLISARHPDLPAASAVGASRTAGSKSLSGDGGKIVFLAHDGNSIGHDTNRLTDAVMRDQRTGTNFGASGSFVGRHMFWPAEWPPSFLSGTNEVNHASISVDGRYVAFAGAAFDPLYAGNFGFSDVVWRDLLLNTIEVIPSLTRPMQYSMSHNGRLLAVAGLDRSGPSYSVVALRDFRLAPPSTRIISRNRAQAIGYANGPSINPVFSPDSRWVVFQSLATDLTYDPDPASGYQLYAREIDSMFLKRISYDSILETNVYSLVGGATNPVFSADARFVFFEGITDRTIYRHDLIKDMNDAGTERRLNLEVCVGCANPSSSADGRLVAYETRPESGSVTNVALKDLESGSVELISVSLSGTNGNGSSFSPLLSHDARFVVFASRASDLVAGDNNRATDIFVRDRWVGVTHCLSRNFAGTGTGNRVSSNPILSADGRTVAFQSFASDLVPGDYNDTRDVFVMTLGGPDGDGDGMEDDWEMAYFNTLERDGSGDFDADGASDLDEFRAGTNPANNNSILRILRLSTGIAEGSSSARTTVILWQSIPGSTYRVEMKEDLNSPWEQVGEQVVAASTTASIGHAQNASGETSNSTSFYRVVLVQ